MSQCQGQGRAPAHSIGKSWREKRSKFLHGQTTRNCNWLSISHFHRLGQRLSERCSVGHCLPGTAFCLCALEHLSRRKEDPLCQDHLPQPPGRRCKVPPAHWDVAASIYQQAYLISRRKEPSCEDRTQELTALAERKI